jgi:hypothetical protein
VPKLDNLDKFIEGIGQEDQERFNAPINQKKPKTSGLGRIRTGDLRHVEAGNSELFMAFSLGDITTRKASAPL